MKALITLQEQLFFFYLNKEVFLSKKIENN